MLIILALAIVWQILGSLVEAPKETAPASGLRSAGAVLCRGAPIPMPSRHVPKLKSDSSRCL